MKDYKNKYFSILGDSISTYQGYIPSGYQCYYDYFSQSVTNIYSSRDTWWGMVIERLEAKLLVNNSWSGSYVCKPKGCEIESYACSDSRAMGLDNDGISPDVVLIYMGSNDRGAGFRLKNNDKTDLSVFENAYSLMLEKIKQKYPKAEVWCLTLPHTKCSRDSFFERFFDELLYATEGVNDIIKATAENNNCKIVDLFENQERCDTIDGLHPNYNGMVTISNKVISELSED